MTTSSVALTQSTDVLSPKVVDYVERYRAFARQTAQSIIQLSTTLVEAQEKLPAIEFALFCREVGLVEGGPIFKKLRKIGDMASRFTPVIERLPNSWTTIYKLASLPADKFDHLVKSDVLTPFATAKQIEHAVEPSATTTKKPQSAADVVLDLTDLDTTIKKAVYDHVYALQKQFRCKVSVSSTLEREIKQHMGLVAQ